MKDCWFLFDAILVILMVFETWTIPMMFLLAGSGNSTDFFGGVNATLFRLLRLVRLSRLMRVMRALPELLYLLKGIVEATRSVSCVCFLLVCILYVFGIIMVQLCAGTDVEDIFPNVPDAMVVLFVQGALLDEVHDLMTKTRAASPAGFVMLFFVIVLAAMTMMNMLVGILCEVVSSVAEKERYAMSTAFIREKVLETLEAIDEDGDGQIAKNEFMAILEHPKAVDALTEASVDVVALVDIADVIFQSDRAGEKFESSLDFDSFMSIVMKFCGTNNATVKDIVDIRRIMMAQSSSMHDLLHRIMRNQKVTADKMKKHFTTSRRSEMQGGVPMSATDSITTSSASLYTDEDIHLARKSNKSVASEFLSFNSYNGR